MITQIYYIEYTECTNHYEHLPYIELHPPCPPSPFDLRTASIRQGIDPTRC